MLQLVLLSVLSLSSSPFKPVPGEPIVAQRSIGSKEARVTPDTKKGPPCGASEGISNLPFARGRRFCALDDYLAYLELQGAIDLPWWRQVRPGVYEHVKRMPGSSRDIVTRAELMKRFGFSE